MRIGPIAHGVLLVVALLFGYQTWTRDKTEDRDVGKHIVWDKGEGSAVRAILEKDKQTTTIERKQDEHGSYVWGEVARSKKKRSKKPESLAPGGADDGAATPETIANPDEFETTKSPFPTNENGEQLLADLSTLHALRTMGKLTDEQRQEYGLADATTNLVVVFKDGSQKTLVVGDSVYGGSDKFVIDPESDNAYVISKEIMQVMHTAATSLGLKNLHDFEKDALQGVVVKTAKGESELVKRTVKDEKGERSEWSYATASAPDVALSNFIDRVLQLKPPGKYDSELDESTLTEIASFQFFGNSKNDIGHLRIYRQIPKGDDGKPQKTEYWIRSAQTRELGKGNRISVERVDQDLVELFKIEPGPDTPEGPVKAAPKMPPGRTMPMKQPGQPSPHGAMPPGMPKGMPKGMPPGMPKGMPPGMPKGMPPGNPHATPAKAAKKTVPAKSPSKSTPAKKSPTTTPTATPTKP